MGRGTYKHIQLYTKSNEIIFTIGQVGKRKPEINRHMAGVGQIGLIYTNTYS